MTTTAKTTKETKYYGMKNRLCIGSETGRGAFGTYSTETDFTSRAPYVREVSPLPASFRAEYADRYDLHSRPVGATPLGH